MGEWYTHYLGFCDHSKISQKRHPICVRMREHTAGQQLFSLLTLIIHNHIKTFHEIYIFRKHSSSYKKISCTLRSSSYNASQHSMTYSIIDARDSQGWTYEYTVVHVVE